MKLFFVVYLAGKMLMIVGPISDTEKECQNRAEIFIESMVESGLLFDGLSIAATCEFHDKNPVLELQ